MIGGEENDIGNQIEMKYQQISYPYRGATYALSAIGTDTPITPWANPLSLCREEEGDL